MAREFISALRSLFNADDAGDQIHFHSGPNGIPAVCEFHGCDRPALSVE